ncbi:MAG: hypothetical protein ACRCV9_13080, partial [Burkholderiaceae bacterium]
MDDLNEQVLTPPSIALRSEELDPEVLEFMAARRAARQAAEAKAAAKANAKPWLSKGATRLLAGWPVVVIAIVLGVYCFHEEPVKLFLVAWALAKMTLFAYLAAWIDVCLFPN